jgi:hypothetical protein
MHSYQFYIGNVRFEVSSNQRNFGELCYQMHREAPEQEQIILWNYIVLIYTHKNTDLYNEKILQFFKKYIYNRQHPYADIDWFQVMNSIKIHQVDNGGDILTLKVSKITSPKIYIPVYFKSLIKQWDDNMFVAI